MALTFNHPSPQSELVADRALYLDKSGTKLLEEGDKASASLLSSRGLPIDPAVVDGLGLVLRGGKVTQDYQAKIAELRQVVEETELTRADVHGRIKEYREAHRVEHAHFAPANKPIPAHLDLERVHAERHHASASARLARAIQAQGGKAW